MTRRPYLSVCSGIEAATVAWEPYGFQPVAFSEIDAFPSAVLAHHYPTVPNWGDMTRFQEWPDADVDVLVGGTPCQSFSVAGLRRGLADPRGNLALTYLAIADRYRPEWLVWENVPGVLSSSGGRDFGAFLGGLVELGYGFAYRVLDAQYVRIDGFGRAVPQRRRRVFVVGCLGDWRRAAAVLFERESLSGNPPPRREAGQGAAGAIARSVALRGRDGGGTAELGDDLADTIRASSGGGDKAHALVAAEVAAVLETTSHDYSRADGFNMIAHALRADGFDASEDGTGRGTPLVPVVAASLTRGAESAGKGGYAGRRQEDDANLVAQPITFGGQMSTPMWDFDLSQTLQAKNPQAVATGWAVRRLTPTECERLQGFPDGYTAVPYRGKPAADGPRYKGLGNSMAVNAMRWLGYRIDLVDRTLARRSAA